MANVERGSRWKVGTDMYPAQARSRTVTHAHAPMRTQACQQVHAHQHAGDVYTGGGGVDRGFKAGGEAGSGENSAHARAHTRTRTHMRVHKHTE